MLAFRTMMAAAGQGALDFALNAPDATVIAAYRADDYTAGDWPDRTANGYDLAQGTAGNQPAAIADGGATLNNKPAVRFDGANDYLIRNTTPAIAQPFTVILLINRDGTTTSTGSHLVTDPDVDTTRIRIDESGDTLGITAQSTITDGTTVLGNGAGILIEAFFNGASSNTRINSAVDLLSNIGTGGLTGLQIGARNDLNAVTFFKGDIAEIILIDGELTEADRVYLALYAAQRYGFAIPFPQPLGTIETIFNVKTTSHAVAMPATVEAKQLLTVQICLKTEEVDTAPEIATPDGWTLKLSHSFLHGITTASVTFAVYCKIADGTEGGATVDFVTTASAFGTAQCHRDSLWYGGMTGVEVDQLNTAGQSDGPNSPLFSPSWGNVKTLWRSITGSSGQSTDTVSAYPTSYSGGVESVSNNVDGSGGASTRSCSRQLEAGSENPAGYNLSLIEVWVAYTLAVRPLRAP